MLKVTNDKTQLEIRILNNFYEYIRKHPNECVMDIMKDFCDEFDIPLEELGFLISEDKYLKDYIENNLIRYHFKKAEAKKSELLESF